MPRTRASAAATISAEPEKPVESEEQVELGTDNEMEETLEEEVEYEEVEEEVEEEEEDEEEEDPEEEVEEEEEEEVENDVDGHGSHKRKGRDGDDDMENAVGEEDDKKKHSELLALPPHGSEIYLGGLSQDTSEDDLKRFCESIGEVTEVRIMKGKENENKGYAFVTFKTKELASKAIKELNNSELKGKKLKCSTSQAKHKLFIGNLPRNWGEKDVKKVVNKVGPGVIAVELLKDPQNSSRNRGYVFIEYYNHACAEYSRQKMSTPKFKLDDNAPTVSWADPKSAESSSSSAQVKAVYLKNLPKNITQDQLKDVFERHDRSSAMKALKNTEKYEIDGQVIECSLAKPQADHKTAGGSNSQKPAIFPTYPPRLGYGMAGPPYGALGAGYSGANFAQPLMYGRGGAPGMAMMPMLLPDGRIGYVL
ncbi:hypothetical protein BUALT_Bualt11G0096500 [Buddleja alternifolia]|uniref:RRM domain-containing protein n=1 Tax=Buddleja alternifolia TaxID=168488 RepID=A0AAV6X0Y1_9LAMI|nr:hypothetical protein BUALT_Bualt11G0096500 [Buddleja alternifolia]